MATAKRKTLPLTHLNDKPATRNYGVPHASKKRVVAGGPGKYERAAKMHRKAKAT